MWRDYFALMNRGAACLVAFPVMSFRSGGYPEFCLEKRKGPAKSLAGPFRFKS